MNFTEKKCLVAYFSRKGMNYTADGIIELKKGNTETAAEIIQQLSHGDLYEICTEEEYPFDYRKCVDQAKKELAENARPKLKGTLPDFSEYDVIFIGYPNWCSTAPMPVFSFLESGDLSGKMIMPFCTNEGSGMGRSETDLMHLLVNSDVRKGIPIRGSTADESAPRIRLWMEAAE